MNANDSNRARGGRSTGEVGFFTGKYLPTRARARRETLRELFVSGGAPGVTTGDLSIQRPWRAEQHNEAGKQPEYGRTTWPGRLLRGTTCRADTNNNIIIKSAVMVLHDTRVCMYVSTYSCFYSSYSTAGLYDDMLVESSPDCYSKIPREKMLLCGPTAEASAFVSSIESFGSFSP